VTSVRISLSSIAASIVLLNGLAWAEPPAETPTKNEAPKQDAVEKEEGKAEPPPRNYANLSLGGSTGSQGLVICAEVAPLAILAISACGNGSGVLSDEAKPELVHFGAHLTLASWNVNSVWLQPRVQAGFAEMQVGEDTAGFDFVGTSATGMATAGPEAGASLRGLLPIYKGVELIGELSLGLAYFAHAPELLRPQSAWQPSATMTLGVGF